MMTKIAKKIWHCMALSAPLLIGNAVEADQKGGKWDTGLRASTLGIQGEVGYLFNETFAMRLQAGGYDHYIKEIEYDKVKYHNVRFRPLITTLYADWYFLTKWWRASAGISYNHTKIRIYQDFSSHQTNLAALSILKAHYRYKNKISPYLGTGIDIRNIFCSKFILSIDAGINYFGEVKVKAFSTGIAANFPTEMAKAHRTAEKMLNDKWWIKYYPTFSIGLKYEI